MAKDKVLLKGVKLEKFGRNRKGGEAHFSASLDRGIKDLMKWAEMPDGYPSASPGGVIVASKMLLKNDEGDLTKYEVGVDISSVGDFEIVQLQTQGKRGKGTRLQLYFKVKFVDVEGCAVLESYITTAADSVGTLEVTYQAASGKVDVTNPAKLDADRQATLDMPDSEDDEDQDGEK